MTKKISRPLTEAEWNALLDKKVQKHIAIEVGKVALKFKLNKENKADLAMDVLTEVAIKIARNYDASKQNMNSFVRLVLPNILKNWMCATYQRSATFTTLEHIVKTQTKATTFEERQILDTLNLLAYEKEQASSTQGQTPYVILARREDCDYARQVIAKLSPVNRRICQEYIKTPNLRKVARRMHFNRDNFYKTIWPHCQREFKKIWGNEEISFHNRFFD